MGAPRTSRDPLRIGAAVLTVAAVLGAMAAGGPLKALIDVHSFLTVLGGGWLAWLAMVGRDRRVLRQVLRGAATGANQLARAEAVALARRRAFWGMGLLHTLVFLIQLFRAFNAPSAIGPLIAVFFIPLLTAALADLLLASPAISRVRQLRLTGDLPAPQRTPTAQRTRQPAGQ